MSPGLETTSTGEIILNIGIVSLASAALFGVGSLLYYGCGFSSEPRAIDHFRTGTWSAEVKTKITNTYIHFFTSFYISLIAGWLVFSNEKAFQIFSSLGMAVVDIIVQTIADQGKAFIRLNTEGMFSTQRIVWFVYCFFVGGMTAPAFLMGMHCVKIAVHITSLLAISLIALSFVSPVGKYPGWKFFLNISEMTVFISSIGTAVFHMDTTTGAFFFTMSFYGGLILFPLYFLCHSQEAHLAAADTNSEIPYSALVMSVPLLLDVISIFSRIVVMIPLTSPGSPEG